MNPFLVMLSNKKIVNIISIMKLMVITLQMHLTLYQMFQTTMDIMNSLLKTLMKIFLFFMSMRVMRKSSFLNQEIQKKFSNQPMYDNYSWEGNGEDDEKLQEQFNFSSLSPNYDQHIGENIKKNMNRSRSNLQLLSFSFSGFQNEENNSNNGADLIQRKFSFSEK